MMNVLLVLNTCVAVALVLIILLQKSDPASGGMFGGAGGTTQTVVRNPLARPTAWLAGAFIVLSLTMAYVNKSGTHQTGSVMATGAPTAAAPAANPADLLQSMSGPALLSATVPVSAAVSPVAPAPATTSPSTQG